MEIQRMVDCPGGRKLVPWSESKLLRDSNTSKASKTGLYILYCSIVVVLMSLIPSCDAVEFHDPIIPNRPVDGFLHSGKFYPKILYWRGIRKPPGVHWFAFYVFVLSAYFCVFLAICPLAAQSNKLYSYLLRSDGKQYLWLLQGSGLTSVLIFSQVSINTLSDEVTAYLIGVCATQLFLDMGRQQTSERKSKGKHFLFTFLTLMFFVFGSVFGVSLLDSYHKLNLMNCVYLNTYVYALAPLAAIVGSFRRYLRARFLGVVISTCHLGFCVWAFLIAREIEDVNWHVLMAFLCTAGASSLLVSLLELTSRRVEREIVADMSDYDH